MFPLVLLQAAEGVSLLRLDVARVDGAGEDRSRVFKKEPDRQVAASLVRFRIAEDDRLDRGYSATDVPTRAPAGCGRRESTSS
jgi:hypothetical protein